MIVLFILLGLAVLLGQNALTCAFIGNVHHVSPDLIPALGWQETFMLMLPLYALECAVGFYKGLTD